MEARAISTAEYSGLSGARTVTAPKPVNPSCFGNIEDVAVQSHRVADRVEKLASRLAGFPPPSPDAGNAVEGEPNGLMEAADRQARDIRNNLQRIIDAVERIEQRLP